MAMRNPTKLEVKDITDIMQYLLEIQAELDRMGLQQPSLFIHKAIGSLVGVTFMSTLKKVHESKKVC